MISPTIITRVPMLFNLTTKHLCDILYYSIMLVCYHISAVMLCLWGTESMEENRAISQEKKDLYYAIMSIETEDECDRFFWDLLTLHELDNLVNRWQIVLRLAEEEEKRPEERKPYKQIAKELNTSPATVGRVDSFLKGQRGKKGYRDILVKIKRQPKPQNVRMEGETM